MPQTYGWNVPNATSHNITAPTIDAANNARMTDIYKQAAL